MEHYHKIIQTILLFFWLLFQCYAGEDEIGVIKFEQTEIDVSDYGAPYDITKDSDGFSSYIGTYVYQPHVIGLTASDGFTRILWIEQDNSQLHLLKLDGNKIIKHDQLENLGFLAGFTSSNEHLFYASASDLYRSQSDIPTDYMSDLIKIYKLDINHNSLLVEDAILLDKDSASGYVYNPLIFGTSRLVYNNNTLLLAYTRNGNGHQGEDNLVINSRDLSPSSGTYSNVRFSPSHSFNQRLLAKDENFLTFSLGDAYPRALQVGRLLPDGSRDTVQTFYIKGNTGDTDVYRTFMGDMAFHDDTILIAFAAENASGTTEDVYTDIAIQKINDKDQLTLSENGSELQVTSGGEVYSNKGINWITNNDKKYALNPKIINYLNYFVLTYELYNEEEAEYEAFAMVVNEDCEVLLSKIELPGARFNRSDSLFIDGQGYVTWVTGDAENKKLILNRLMIQ